MKSWLLAISFACIAFANEAVALPAGIFGLPEGVISAGGTAEWEVLSATDSSADGLKTTLTSDQRTAWLDLTVNGPAEVSCLITRIDSWAHVEFSVDGISRAVADSYGNPDLTLEVPAGAHVVRVAASLRVDYPYSSSLMVLIPKLTITQLAGPGKFLTALGGDLPFVTQGLWEAATSFPGALGNSSIRSVTENSVLQTGFVGPGYLDFRFALSREQAGRASTMSIRSDTDPSLLSYFFYDEEMPSWREGRQWFPPGPQRVWFNIYGDASSLSQSVLDAVRFTPSAIVSVEDALDDTGVIWENDPAAPWVGALRNLPSDDVLVSPTVAIGQTTRFATTLTGPGEFSFNASMFRGSGEVEWSVAGQRRYFNLSGENDRFTIQLLDSTPARIEWTVRGNQNNSSPSSRLLLDDVRWTPFPASPLAEALDTNAAVTWTTAAKLPFTGRPHPTAKNGTAAYIALKPGEESWLEATVNGPGRFDFWLREAAGIALPQYGYLWNYWSLSIDGVPVEISGYQWPEQWITGEGPHRIRLTFRHPLNSGVEWLTGAADEVTWIPMARTSLAKGSGLKNSFWQTSGDSPANGFSNAGRANAPGVVMNPERWKTSWARTFVMGPCELSWDSALKRSSGEAVARLEVNGVNVTDFDSHSWQRMRLSLPKGVHAVRWVYERRPPSEFDELLEHIVFSQAWQISGMRVQKGFSSLAQAVDLASLYALETGDSGGQRVVEGRTDYWKPGLGAGLYFFDPRQTGKLIASYQSGGAYGQSWMQQDHTQSPIPLPSLGQSWLLHTSALHPRGYSKWSFDPGDLEADLIEFPRLGSLRFESGASVGLAAAIESSQPLSSDSWFGLTDRNAPVGRDFAWSLLNQENSVATATMTLVGPAKLSYWWKKLGGGTLNLSLNGAHLPVPPPSMGWTKVEFTIGSGNHALVWSHSQGFLSTSEGITPGMSPPSEAWLDGFVSLPTSPISLTAAGTKDGSPVLTASTNSPDFLPWQPVSYREADGRWTEAVRVVSGGRKLHATVTGPIVIEFRGRCFEGDVVSSSRRFPRSVIISIPDNRPQTTGHLLTVDIGGVKQLQVDTDSSGAWRTSAVHVPAGIHEVTFRLVAVQSSWFGTSLVDSTEANVQAWVDDLRVVSSSEHYAEWAKNQNLAVNQSGKGNDPDADGSSNFMEYSFGTDSRDAASRPLGLSIEMFSPYQLDRGFENISGETSNALNEPYPFLKIPYLPPHVSAVIESTEDLVNWQAEPIEMLRYPILRNIIVVGGPLDTPTYHVRNVTKGVPRRYYRLAVQE